jgi:hypothetical protein
MLRILAGPTGNVSMRHTSLAKDKTRRKTVRASSPL